MWLMLMYVWLLYTEADNNVDSIVFFFFLKKDLTFTSVIHVWILPVGVLHTWNYTSFYMQAKKKYQHRCMKKWTTTEKEGAIHTLQIEQIAKQASKQQRSSACLSLWSSFAISIEVFPLELKSWPFTSTGWSQAWRSRRSINRMLT